MEIASCLLYDCCMSSKHLEHCGLCNEFPCTLFLKMRDPSLSNTEAEQALKDRQKTLERRKKIGTGSWLGEIIR
jgi:hypothetical protein